MIPKTDNPTPYPFSDHLYDLLANRKENANTNYVFAGTGKGGLIEPRKQMAKVIEECNIQFTVHDLHRTFITIAESLDIPAYALKRLLNHKMTSDVTAGYIIVDAERLRKPMKMITEHLLLQMGLEPSSIIPLPKAHKNQLRTDHERQRVR